MRWGGRDRVPAQPRCLRRLLFSHQQEWVSESCEVTSDPQTTLQHLLKVCDSSELGSHTFFSAKKYFVNV